MASMFMTMISMALFANANSPNLLKCYSAYLTAQEDGNSNFFTVQGLEIPENGEDFTVDEWWAYHIDEDLAAECATEEVFHFMKKVFAGDEGAIQFMVTQFMFDPIAEQWQGTEHEEVEENSVAEVAEESTGRRSLIVCMLCFYRCCIPAAERAHRAVTNAFAPQQQAPALEAPVACIMPVQNFEVADVYQQQPQIVLPAGQFDVHDIFNHPGEMVELPEGEFDVADIFNQPPQNLNHHVHVIDDPYPLQSIFDDHPHPASPSTRSSSRNRRTVRVCGVNNGGRDLRRATQIQVRFEEPSSSSSHPIHDENRRLAELHRNTFVGGWNSFSSSVSSGWDSFSSSVGGLFGRRSLHEEGTTSNPAHDVLMSNQGKPYDFPVQEMLSNCDEFGDDPICLLAQWGPIEFQLWIEEMCNLEAVQCESFEGRRALLDDLANGKYESNSVNQKFQGDSNVHSRRKM